MIIPFEGGALRPLHNDDKPAFTSLINDRNNCAFGVLKSAGSKSSADKVTFVI